MLLENNWNYSHPVQVYTRVNLPISWHIVDNVTRYQLVWKIRYQEIELKLIEKSFPIMFLTLRRSNVWWLTNDHPVHTDDGCSTEINERVEKNMKNNKSCCLARKYFFISFERGAHSAVRSQHWIAIVWKEEKSHHWTFPKRQRTVPARTEFVCSCTLCTRQKKNGKGKSGNICTDWMLFLTLVKLF